MQDELQYRKELARQLLSDGMGPRDFDNTPLRVAATAAQGLAQKLQIPFPAGLDPRPQSIAPSPALDAPLPKADIVVVTWTVDEVDALAHVLTPGISRDSWYRYARQFEQYLPAIRPGAPARGVKRLASYRPTTIGGKHVLCIKSELHMNQDGVQTPPTYGPHNASLPVADLLDQVIDETGASLVITTGTAGAVYAGHNLGDVVITRGALFRVAQEFQAAPFANASYRSDWEVPQGQFAAAQKLMRGFKDQLAEPEFLPPTVNYAPLDHLPKPIRANEPEIKLDGRDMPAFHPILTTDYFEFGTSVNRLDQYGAAVEMGDAALGLVVERRKAAGRSVPHWLVIRNCSDPQINGALRDRPASQSLQAMWAVYYYKGFGYWTSVNSALACWAVIAGLP
jgi:nucleoside phosphorylase